VGPTAGMLESMPLEYIRELLFHSGHSIAFNKGRGHGRFSIEELFKDSDKVTLVVGHITEQK
jgi:hypothetical protein